MRVLARGTHACCGCLVGEGIASEPRHGKGSFRATAAPSSTRQPWDVLCAGCA